MNTHDFLIRNPTPTQRALLTWRSRPDLNGLPNHYAIAEIIDTKMDISFNYFREALELKEQYTYFHGYHSLPMDANYDLGSNAIECLSRRLIPKHRLDYKEWISRFGLSVDDCMSHLTMLARTGACLTGDTFSVVETFDGFNPPFSYMFVIDGFKYELPEKHVDLNIGDPVIFIRGVDKEYDTDAIVVTCLDGTHLGYVNRFQTKVVGQWVDDNRITGKIFRATNLNNRFLRPCLTIQANVI